MANIIEVDRINNIVILGTTGTTTRFPFCAANRMIYLNSESDVTSISDLTNWIAGTENQIVVTDDGDGTVTLSLPQNIHTDASPTFAGLTISGTGTFSGILVGVGGINRNSGSLILGIDGNPKVSITATTITLDGNLIIPDNGTIGSASDTDAIQIEADGDIVVSQDFAVTGTISQGGTILANTYQPLDAGLTSLAGLTYASDSFIKVTAEDTYAIRTIAETADDLEGTIDHDNLTNTHDLTADIDHDAITNYVANKHIDHTGVTLTAGVGLSGGGDISANRTFDFDINGLDEVDPPTLSNCYIPVYYTGTSNHKKVLGTKLGMFVDRGDAAGYDWDETTLTTKETWTDLDCSSVVPANAKAILFHVILEDDSIEVSFRLRENGNNNIINVGSLIIQVSNVAITNDIVVPCDSNRIVEYYISNVTWSRIDLVIKGWWF